jgi:hypothetical protein
MTAFEIPDDIDTMAYARIAGELAAQEAISEAPSIEATETTPTVYSNGKTFPGTITEARMFQERQEADRHALAFAGHPAPPRPQLTRADLQEMSPVEINEAHAKRQLDGLLGLI